MMKATELTQYGFEYLSLTERPIPEPRAGEVQVKIEAVALNYLDLSIARGEYAFQLSFPAVPTSDGSGVVTQVGQGVTRWTIGDRVTVQYIQDWIGGELTAEIFQSKVGQHRPGVLAEYITLPAHGLVRTPAHLSSLEAATLPIAGLTAWTGLIENAHLYLGQTVLTQGTGGVSMAALQLAKAAGARVIATSGSDEKLEKLKALGADEVINYRKVPDWDQEVKRLTGGRGADVTLDITGGETLSKSVNAVKLDGTVGIVGYVSGMETLFNVGHAIVRGTKLKGSHVGSRTAFENYVRALEQNAIRPVIDRVFDFDQVREAYAYLASGNHFGKVVIRV